jgi:two-component system, OmpR family, phosphate regulon sensor histidine kinase PhoR
MRPLVIFYLLVIYVLLQFSWWAYLLIELNKEVYRYKTEIVQLRERATGSTTTTQTTFEYNLKERFAMVAGEGLVFLAILIFGIYKTRDAFRKEVSLARQQKNFLLSITHEFKSPLAAVKLNLQTLQKRELDKEQQEHMITRALGETERIHNLIENALLAARIESHSFILQKEEFNFSDFVESVIKSRGIPGMPAKTTITHLDKNIYVKGDTLALTSLLLNLIENAEKYSPADKQIIVSLKRKKSFAVLTIADQGNGVPDKEKSKIFEKFYRVGNEETRNTKGTGLGLYIVRHVAGLHRGTVTVKDNVPSGAVFEVTLPIENEGQ